MRRTIGRLGVIAVAAGIGLGSLALTGGTAFAATSASTAVSADITAGTLSVTAPSSLAYAATLNGSDQSLSQPATLGANDNTGTGDGWNVTVASTALTATANSASITIPSNWTVELNGSSSSASSTTGPALSQNQPSGSTGTYTNPSGNTATYPLAIPGVHGAASPTPATVYTAAAGSGMGDFNLAADVWQNIPANADAGSYSATFTWTIAVGP